MTRRAILPRGHARSRSRPVIFTVIALVLLAVQLTMCGSSATVVSAAAAPPVSNTGHHAGHDLHCEPVTNTESSTAQKSVPLGGAGVDEAGSNIAPCYRTAASTTATSKPSGVVTGRAILMTSCVDRS